MKQYRTTGVCTQCQVEGDLKPKELHGKGMCERHYRADKRRQEAELDPDLESRITEDRHAAARLRAHEFVAERTQTYLHVLLNHQKYQLIVPSEKIQQIRDLLNPIYGYSQRVASPGLMVGQGDTSPGINSEVRHIKSSLNVQNACNELQCNANRITIW